MMSPGNNITSPGQSAFHWMSLCKHFSIFRYIRSVFIRTWGLFYKFCQTRFWVNLDLSYGYSRRVHTHMSEAVSCQVVALKKPLVTHGASVRFHSYTHRAAMYHYCASLPTKALKHWSKIQQLLVINHWCQFMQYMKFTYGYNSSRCFLWMLWPQHTELTYSS